MPRRRRARPPRRRDRVYDGIYAAMIDHRLPPGARLREEELAADLRGLAHRWCARRCTGWRRTAWSSCAPTAARRCREPTRETAPHVFDARRVVECEVARRLAGRLDAAPAAPAAPPRRRPRRGHRGAATAGGDPAVGRVPPRAGAHERQPAVRAHARRTAAHHLAADGAVQGAAASRCAWRTATASCSPRWTAAAPAAAATEMRRHLNEIERSLDAPAPRAIPALRDVFKPYRATPMSVPVRHRSRCRTTAASTTSASRAGRRCAGRAARGWRSTSASTSSTSPSARGWAPRSAPAAPQPDVLNYSWREYGNRVGAWRCLELFDELALPAGALDQHRAVRPLPRAGRRPSSRAATNWSATATPMPSARACSAEADERALLAALPRPHGASAGPRAAGLAVAVDLGEPRHARPAGGSRLPLHAELVPRRPAGADAHARGPRCGRCPTRRS